MRTWSDQMTDACPQAVTTETLSAWRDATLPAPDADALAHHAPTCRACAERLALFDAIEDALRQQRTPAPRPSLWGEVYTRITDEAGAIPGAAPGGLADAPTASGMDADDAGRRLRLSPTSQRGRATRERQRLRRRWGALSAAIAAALIAALLIGLLVSRQLFTSTGGTPTPTAHTPVSSVTAAASPSATGSALPAGWQSLTALANGPAQPVIAPSNPQVVYFAAAGTTTKGVAPTYLLARSDDGGVTLHHLPFPTLNGQTIDTFSPLFINLFVSPLNPQTVYLYTQVSVAACPANFVPFAMMRRVSRDARQSAQHDAPSLASAVCQPEYISVNGGETWNLLNLPAKGLLGVMPPDGNRSEPAIQVQGTRLYSTVADVPLAASGVPPGGRLVVSVDGGVTWSLVDAPIAAQGLQVYDFAPTPTGSTIFVVSENPQTDQAPTYTPDPHLWRSDDAGASWKEIGATPGGSVNSGVNNGAVNGMAATVSSSGQSLVYLETASGKGAQSSTTLEVSVDGGLHWQNAPDAGSLGDVSYPLGVTASGKVVMIFADGSFRAWAEGAGAWTTVAPSLGSSFSATTYFISAVDGSGDGKLALYAIGQNDSTNTSVVARYVLR